MAVRLNTKLSGANAIKKWNDKVGSVRVSSNPTQTASVQTGVVNRANSKVFGGLKNGNASSAVSAAGSAMDNIRNAARGWNLNNPGGGNGISRGGSGNGTPNVSKLPYSAGNAKITKLSNNSTSDVADVSAGVNSAENSSQSTVGIVPVNSNVNEYGNKAALGEDDVMVTEYIGSLPNGSYYWDEENRDLQVNGLTLPKSEVYLSPEGKSYVNKDFLDGVYALSGAGESAPSPEEATQPSYITDNGNRAFKTDEDVVVTDYLKSRPDSSVRWDATSGDLYVNGYRVPKNEVYLSPEGKSFVNRSTLDSIYRQTVENDPMSAYSVMKNFNDSQADLKSYLEEARNPQKFSYDPTKDKMFKYYSDYYDMLADRAVDDALGQLMGRTGGYVNSNALAAAYQARNNFMQQKANIIPTLEQNAYERFASDRDSYNSNIAAALQNIANNNIAYADALNALRTGWNDNQNAALDRELDYERLYTDDENADNTLKAQVEQWNRQGDQTDRELDIKEQQVDNDYEVGLINKGYVKNEDGSLSPVAPVAVPVAGSASSSGSSKSSGSTKTTSEEKKNSGNKSSGSSKSSGGKSSTLIPIV